MTRKRQRHAEAVQDLSVAGDREVLSKVYDPQNTDRTGQAQQRYDEIEPRRDAEITALQRLIPGLSDSGYQHLRPALRFWCAAARKYLTLRKPRRTTASSRWRCSKRITSPGHGTADQSAKCFKEYSASLARRSGPFPDTARDGTPTHSRSCSTGSAWPRGGESA